MKNNLIKYVFCVCLLPPITIATGTENAKEIINDTESITTINYCKKNTLSALLEKNRKALAELNKLKQSVVKPIIQENICTPGKFEKNELFRQIMIWIEQKRAERPDKFAFGASPSFYQYGFSSTIVYWDLVSDKYKPKQDDQITATSIVNSFRCVGANLCEALHYYTMLVQKYNNELCDENGEVYDFVLDDLRLYISSRLSRSENISNISYIKGVLSFALIMDKLLKTITNKTGPILVHSLMNEKDAEVSLQLESDNRNLWRKSLGEVYYLHNICRVSSLIDMITREFNSVIKNGIKDNRTESRTIIKNGSKNKGNKNKTTEYKIAESMKVSIYDKLPNYYILMKKLGANVGDIGDYKAAEIFDQIITHIDEGEKLNYTDIERKSNYLLNDGDINDLVAIIKDWPKYYKESEFNRLWNCCEDQLSSAFSKIQEQIDKNCNSIFAVIQKKNESLQKTKKSESRVVSNGLPEINEYILRTVLNTLNEMNKELKTYVLAHWPEIGAKYIDILLQKKYNGNWELQFKSNVNSATAEVNKLIEEGKKTLAAQEYFTLLVKTVKKSIEELHKWMVQQIKDNPLLHEIKLRLDKIEKNDTNRESYQWEVFNQELIIRSIRNGPALYKPDCNYKKENGSETGPTQSTNETNNKVSKSDLQEEYVPKDLIKETDCGKYEFDDKPAIASEIYKKVLDTATDYMAERWKEWGDSESKLEEYPKFDYMRYDMQQFFNDNEIRRWSKTFDFLCALTKNDSMFNKNYQDLVCSCDGYAQLSRLSEAVKESIKMYINRNGLSLNNKKDFTILDRFYYPNLCKYENNKIGMLFKRYKYNYNILTLSGSDRLNSDERKHKLEIAFTDKCITNNELFEVERHIPDSSNLEDVKIYIDYCRKFKCKIGECVINTNEFKQFAEEVAQSGIEHVDDDDIELFRLVSQMDAHMKKENHMGDKTQDNLSFDADFAVYNKQYPKKKDEKAKTESDDNIRSKESFGNISSIK